ncbi:glutathione S-transferase kappa 1-like protein, partial [Aphelenchoides avenae]
QLCAAEKAHHFQMELRPVCNSSLMSSVGNSSPFYLAAPRAYLFDEAEFLGHVHELGLRVPKNAKETLSATGTSRAQAFLAFVAEEHPASLRDCSRTLWQRLWVHDMPVHRREDFNEVARSCGMTMDLSDADMADERWSRKLRENERMAIDSEVRLTL